VPTRLIIRWTGPCKKSAEPARTTSRFLPPSGTFSQRRVFSRHGKVFDTCEAKGVTWSVS
jgi:hypothetical protein